jgi:peptide chain release factor 1
MFEKLEAKEERYEELTALMSQPDVYNDFSRVQAVSQERSALEAAVNKYRQYKSVSKQIDETQGMIDLGLDVDMLSMADRKSVV